MKKNKKNILYLLIGLFVFVLIALLIVKIIAVVSENRRINKELLIEQERLAQIEELHNEEIANDADKYENAFFDTALVSMFNLNNISSSWFSEYMGLTAVMGEGTPRNIPEISKLLDAVFYSEGDKKEILLGIDPLILGNEEKDEEALIASLKEKKSLQSEKEAKKNPILIPEYENNISTFAESYIGEKENIIFRVILPIHKAEYWQERTLESLQNELETYREVVDVFSKYENVIFYCFTGEKWLILNDESFDEDILSVTGSQKLFLDLYGYDTYILTKDNQEKFYNRINEIRISNEKLTLDLSDTDLLFMGDSIFDKDRTSYSAPEIIKRETKASCFNYAIGGTSVVPDENSKSFTEVSKDFAYEQSDNKKQIVLINYGFNDYFKGNKIGTYEDMGVTDSTFYGAFYTAITNLKKKLPEARIVVLIPYFINSYERGKNTFSDEGGELQDYREAIFDIVNRMDLEYIDAFLETGFSTSSYKYFTPDEVHPGDPGQYEMAEMIIKYLTENKRFD